MAANYNSNSLEEGMRVLQPHVGHLHIADALGVSGEGIQIGEGNVDFDAVREIFLSSKSGPTWIPEIWQGHLGGGGGYAEALRRLANLGF
jgi:N-acetylneuraminate synthase